MKKISYSQYSMWAQCPHRWKTAYIDGNREFSDSIHTLFGTSMHEVIQTFLTVMYNDTAKMAEALPLEDMLLTRMKRNFENVMVVRCSVLKRTWLSFMVMVWRY